MRKFVNMGGKRLLGSALKGNAFWLRITAVGVTRQGRRGKALRVIIPYTLGGSKALRVTVAATLPTPK